MCSLPGWPVHGWSVNTSGAGLHLFFSVPPQPAHSRPSEPQGPRPTPTMAGSPQPSKQLQIHCGLSSASGPRAASTAGRARSLITKASQQSDLASQVPSRADLWIHSQLGLSCGSHGGQDAEKGARELSFMGDVDRAGWIHFIPT